MTRTIFPMAVPDLSAFARTVRDEIGKLDHPPSHVEMLNLLTRSAGYKNFQHFRATVLRADELANWNLAAPPAPVPDEARVAKMLRLFDGEGRLLRWPSKRAQQELCLWFLWSKIPAGRLFSEREISQFLNTLHLFGDPALLRRDLADLGLVRRNRDGSDYTKVDKQPPPDLDLLFSKLGARKVEPA